MNAGKSLVIRDLDFLSGYTAEIVIEQQFNMTAGGSLQLKFDADQWDSLITFTPGTEVIRGGTLALDFAASVNMPAQIGRTFDLFDWTGVVPTGVFDIACSYTWDLSKLYTTGEVTRLRAGGSYRATSTATVQTTSRTTSSGARRMALLSLTTHGARTSASRSAAVRTLARMPPSPNLQLWY